MSRQMKWEPVPSVKSNPANNTPDYGEYHAKTFGDLPLTLVIDPPATTGQDYRFVKAGRDFFISFSDGGYIGTIEMINVSESFAAQCYEKAWTTGLNIKAVPSKRYWSEVTQEWVTPFHVIKEVNLCPTSDFDLSRILKAEQKREKRAARNLKLNEIDRE